MLMSDANKGLFGRKRGVGAMRGIISLAVIFFVALSAQPSAEREFIECQAETRTNIKADRDVRSFARFYLAYDIVKNKGTADG